MTGRPAYIRPDRWTPAYTLSRRIDTAAETLAGLAGAALLVASRGLLWAAQHAIDTRLDRAEKKAAGGRVGAAISRELDRARIGELPDDEDQE